MYTLEINTFKGCMMLHDKISDAKMFLVKMGNKQLPQKLGNPAQFSFQENGRRNNISAGRMTKHGEGLLHKLK